MVGAEYGQLSYPDGYSVSQGEFYCSEIQRALYLVSHKRLVKAMEGFGILPNVLRLIIQWLTGESYPAVVEKRLPKLVTPNGGLP